jgi:hypothetical protein
MKNIFRSDSEMVTSQFAYQQAKPSEKIKELVDMEVADVDGTVETKEALNHADMSKDVLKSEIEVPESAVKAKIDEVKALLEEYKTMAGEAEAEVDVIAVLNTIKNEEVRAYVAEELGIKLENFEALDADAEFNAGEMVGEGENDEKVTNSFDDIENDMENNAETPSFSEEEVVKLYYEAKETEGTDKYYDELVKAFLNDINLVKGDMEDREKNKQKKGAFKGTEAKLAQAYTRLEKLFPEEFGKENNEFPNFESMKEKVKGLTKESLIQTKEEFPTDYENTETFGEYLKTIPGRLLTAEGEPKGTAKEYYAAIKEGYRGTFDEWNDEKPRSAIGGFLYRIMKMFRESGLGEMLKDSTFLPDWLKKFMGADLDEEETGDRLKESDMWGDHEEAVKAREAAETISENKEEWFNAKESTDATEKDLFDKFNIFRGEYNNMFAFLNGVGEGEDLSTVEKADNMPDDFGAFSKEEFKNLQENTDMMAILEKFKDSKTAISLESWKTLLEKPKELKIENGVVILTHQSETKKTLEEWSDAGVKEALKVPQAEADYDEHVSKFNGIAFKDIPTGKGLFTDKKEKKQFSPTFLSFLEDVPVAAWEGAAMTIKDLERFEHRVGDPITGGRRNFDKGSDTFYTNFKKGGKYFADEPGRNYEKLSDEEIKEKKKSSCAFAVQGTGNITARDYKFENVKAFFLFLGEE